MKKILVVEDELVIALSMSMVLEQEGYTVVMASDGVDGLAKAREEAPDLIITDYMMPRMDGLEMIAALRAEGAPTPIILATAISQDWIARHADSAHDFHLAKPFRDTELVAAVRKLLD